MHDMNEMVEVRATSAAPERAVDNPSDEALHDLLAAMNFRYPYIIVERPNRVPLGHYYIQVHMDEHVDPEDGRGYFIEYRDGGPDRHFRATVHDTAPWDSAYSPAFELVVKVVQDWASQRPGWRDALSWERIDFED